MLDLRLAPVREDVNVHVIDMDTMVEEQVVKNDDGSYSIFLNARLSTNMQREAYLHALSHICCDDFYKDCADDIEVEAHARTW